MIHGLFCVGRFSRYPGHPGQAMLEPARRALSPVVARPITQAELRAVARSAGQPKSENELNQFLADNGVIHVEGYLEVSADRVHPAGNRYIEELCRTEGCQVIDCLGRFVPMETLIGYTSA